jgi:hypothetical protein
MELTYLWKIWKNSTVIDKKIKNFVSFPFNFDVSTILESGDKTNNNEVKFKTIRLSSINI